jgi:hypothetical protein
VKGKIGGVRNRNNCGRGAKYVARALRKSAVVDAVNGEEAEIDVA